jgi:hypothetical protein
MEPSLENPHDPVNAQSREELRTALGVALGIAISGFKYSWHRSCVLRSAGGSRRWKCLMRLARPLLNAHRPMLAAQEHDTTSSPALGSAAQLRVFENKKRVE